LELGDRKGGIPLVFEDIADFQHAILMSAYKIPNRGVADLHSPTNGMAVGSQKLVVLPDSAWQTSFPDS